MPRALPILSALALTVTLLSAQASAPDPPAVPSPSSHALRVLVLDPGHGGDDTGAQVDGGLVEKQVTLDLVRRLQPLLESRLGIRVVLTRMDDRTLTPDQRAGAANSAHADAVITVHVNSSVRPSASGPEIFLHQSGATPLSPPSVEGAADHLPVPGGQPRPLTFTPWSAVQSQHLFTSRALGEHLALAVGTRFGGTPLRVRAVPLRMLAGVNAPAVHLELGYLTNPDEAVRLASELFQTQMADGLVDALTQFRGDAEAAQ